MKKVLVCSMLFLSSLCIAQTVLNPTELESAKLAKLKAQKETIQAQISQVDIQIQGLQAVKQLLSEHMQQKQSELLSEAERVKEAHKDWGDNSKINYNEGQGESGVFSKPEEKKPELPVPSNKPPQGQVKK